MSAIARVLQVSQSNLLAPRRRKLARATDAAEDAVVLGALRAVASNRSTYGYRRTTAIVNRERRSRGEAPVDCQSSYKM